MDTIWIFIKYWMKNKHFQILYNILLETMNMILSVRSRLILLANWHFYDCVRNLHKVFAANGLALFLLIGFHHLFHRMCCLKGSKKKLRLSKIWKEKNMSKHSQAEILIFLGVSHQNHNFPSLANCWRRYVPPPSNASNSVANDVPSLGWTMWRLQVHCQFGQGWHGKMQKSTPWFPMKLHLNGNPCQWKNQGGYDFPCQLTPNSVPFLGKSYPPWNQQPNPHLKIGRKKRPQKEKIEKVFPFAQFCQDTVPCNLRFKGTKTQSPLMPESCPKTKTTWKNISENNQFFEAF